MSSRSEPFECRWQASRLLLTVHLAVLAAALVALAVAPAPAWLCALLALACLGYSARVVPRQILLGHPRAWCRVRHDDDGWALWSPAAGWTPVALRPDSMALPAIVILRYRCPGQWFSRGLCIARDALPREVHRRLRVRLKFSRRRWAVPG